MILLYHKVDLTNSTYWWVSADAFNRQLAALRAYDVVYLDEYDPDNPRHAVISFDGIYENVARVALPILKKWDYPFELFIVGDYVGKDNTFDQHVEPPCRFADFEELDRLVHGGGRLQWHTATHCRMNGLSDEQLERELTVPDSLRRRYGEPHLRWFGYPHGEHDPRVEQAVEKRFVGALSCIAGNDVDRYKLNRLIVHEGTTLFSAKTSVIIANYNYGRFLPQAVESVLEQTTSPDEILIIDDASDDNSREAIESYRDRVTRIEYNEANLGIVRNFRKAVSLTSGEYIVILGADNRMRCDYLERCRAALDANPKTGVAYTDMSIFGGRARLLAEKVGARMVGRSQLDNFEVFHWQFPDPTPSALAKLDTNNFIHGSSMFRRAAYDEVGGYRESDSAEDHDLFRRIVASGWSPVHVAHPLLEYRQHSTAQANTVLGLEFELARRQREIAALRAELARLKKSKVVWLMSEWRRTRERIRKELKRLGRKLERIGRKIRARSHRT